MSARATVHESVLAYVWEPADDNGVTTLRFGTLRARVNRSHVRSEGWLWTIDATGCRGLRELAHGHMRSRAKAKRVAERVLTLLTELSR